MKGSEREFPRTILTLALSHNAIKTLSKGGTFNYGGYCNPKVEDLAKRILVEADVKKRDDLIFEAFTIIHEEVGLIPLHQQALVWGVSKKTKIAQRADNQILLYWVQKQD